MRAVNLLPERYRPARATGRLRGSSYVTIGVLAVLLLMVLGYVITNNQINSNKEDANEAIAEAQAAEARAAQLGAFGDFLQVKQQREAAVKTLALSRFDYERLLREMALALPDDVFLTQFATAAAGQEAGAASPTVSAVAPQLTLGGCAPDHRSVADTVVRMRNLHNVTDVVLNTSASGESAEGGGEGGCRTSWTATLTFEPEVVQADRPSVPARLGGGS